MVSTYCWTCISLCSLIEHSCRICTAKCEKFLIFTLSYRKRIACTQLCNENIWHQIIVFFFFFLIMLVKSRNEQEKNVIQDCVRPFTKKATLKIFCFWSTEWLFYFITRVMGKKILWFFFMTLLIHCVKRVESLGKLCLLTWSIVSQK